MPEDNKVSGCMAGVFLFLSFFVANLLGKVSETLGVITFIVCFIILMKIAPPPDDHFY